MQEATDTICSAGVLSMYSKGVHYADAPALDRALKASLTCIHDVVVTCPSLINSTLAMIAKGGSDSPLS